MRIKVAPQPPCICLLASPGSLLWTTVGLLTATCDFLKSRAGILHLVTSQKQLRGPAPGLIPARRHSPSTDNLQKAAGTLRPPVLTASCPQERAQRWECPRYLQLSRRCGRQKLLLWAGREGFQGFLFLWGQNFTTRRTCAICGTVEWGKSRKHTCAQVFATEARKQKGATSLQNTERHSQKASRKPIYLPF